MSGPKMYPIRNTLIGKTSSVVDDTPKEAVILGIAMLGRAEDMVELRTSITVMATTKVLRP